MTPNQLIPQLEGLVGSGLRGAANASGRQYVTTWLEALKTIMRSQGLRDATDWELVADPNAVEAAGSTLDATGGTVYGVLVDSIYDSGTESLIAVVADLTGTFTATSLDFGVFGVDGGVIFAYVPVSDGTIPQFGTWLDPAGQVFNNDLFCMADGEESSAIVANDVRIYIVYRSTTALRV